MATLLDGVNAVLRRRKLIQGDADVLTTLSDQSRQIYIDEAIALWSETIDQLYTMSCQPMPKEMAETTITLVTAQRSYTLPADMVQIRWPLINEANGYVIEEYPGGYDQMRRDQLQPDNYTGRPQYAAINPIDDTLYVDQVVPSSDNGLEYRLVYDKDLSLSLATDVFPFNDAVYRALVPVVAEYLRRNFDNTFDQNYVRLSMGRASQFLTQNQQRETWKSRARNVGLSDPYNA